MLRKILCDYEFIFRGRGYKSYDLYLGDTTVPYIVLKRDLTPQIVSSALKLSIEELGNLIKVHYWDLDRPKLEHAGFIFIKIEINFSPPLSQKD